MNLFVKKSDESESGSPVTKLARAVRSAIREWWYRWVTQPRLVARYNQRLRQDKPSWWATGLLPKFRKIGHQALDKMEEGRPSIRNVTYGRTRCILDATRTGKPAFAAPEVANKQHHVWLYDTDGWYISYVERTYPTRDAARKAARRITRQLENLQ